MGKERYHEKKKVENLKRGLIRRKKRHYVKPKNINISL